ncbi:putative endopeptidase [Kineosphaera limosa]|uniref:Putative metalloendopeptidase n=1 Tax=Kineosphaera limosa NBRC 100340 TaxID=1184609 RepID=K6WU03_9MICO|nr:M13-type metalloendopeptidase [Kineosphaera limosa]NYD99637.1 putative endopeptidase [Kineosphaera limosa]GAB95592.1 putative metalloendopeptidase [Kineosphaera limosa NBRC 100340]
MNDHATRGDAPTQNSTPGAHSGLDTAGMDRGVRPQDDLFGFVNGAWVRTTQIPQDKGRYGTFDLLRDEAQEHVRALLEQASAEVTESESAETGGAADEREAELRALVGALYASFMDVDRVEELGLRPVHDELAAIDAAPDAAALWAVLGKAMREGVASPAVAYVHTDKRASDQYVTYVYQGGLGLPDEAYYREEQYEQLRAQYLDHIEAMFTLAGRPDPAAEARTVLDLETRLAASHWDRVATRDAVKTYTKLTRAELEELAPHVPWEAWREGLGAPADAFDPCVVGMPDYLRALSAAVRDVPHAAWQSWARWHVLSARAPYLSSAFVDEDFDFFGRTLSGTPEQRERWRRAIGLVDALAGEATGRLYVREHFSPAAKERMETLVANLVEAYRRDISELEWMSPATREKALEKLAKFTPKIGYPAVWRDYSGLEFDAADLVRNVRAGYAFEADRDWAKLGGPVDRDEWFMSPQTVNAYYNPGMNEIVFPAAILQPPFFDAAADDAVNYGAIGSVIGHEIGHGFDDQGSRYDGDGELVDWWTEEDRERFDELAGALIAQYDGLSGRDLPDEQVNGKLTVGENIGDLGGVTIAHLAYRISKDGQEAPVIDDLTGDQRFFAGWAQGWRGKARPEEAKRLLSLDPHSPMDLRANIVRNLTEFYDAYDVQPGDALWLEPQDRVRIW